MTVPAPRLRAPVATVALALACTWLLWGGAFIAIKVLLRVLPPFVLGGLRFLIAGSLLVAWRLAAGDRLPTARQWRSAFIIGALMFIGGTGTVIVAQQRLPSGISALLAGMAPLWMVLVDWLRPGGVRPTRLASYGILLGLVGIAVLLGPDIVSQAGTLHVPSALFILIGMLGWSIGSVWSRTAALPASGAMSTGAAMLGGGVCFLTISLIRNEWPQARWEAIEPVTVLAFAYYLAAGIFGFIAYTWLLKNASLALASTYAYVNPVVAMALGWVILRESLTLQTLLSAAIIIVAVFVIASPRARMMDSPP